MAGDPLSAERPFQFEGRDYVAVFDWQAIAAYEKAMGESIVVILADLDRYDIARKSGHPEAWRLTPRTNALAELMRAGLSRYHPEVMPPEALRMFSDPAVQAAFGLSLADAMPRGADDAAGEPNAAGATKDRPRRSRGKSSSGDGARRDKDTRTSGARRRA